MKNNHSFPLWKTFLFVFILLLGAAIAMVFIVAVIVTVIAAAFNLLLLTYCCGYTGLVVRMTVITVWPVLAIALAVGRHIHKQKENKKDHFLLTLSSVLVVAVIFGFYFDLGGTWGDLHSQPVSAEYEFVIAQQSTEAHMIINTEETHPSFRMSLFERVRDKSGKAIFLPFHDGEEWGLSLYRRVWFSDGCRGTFVYYPNTGTRAAITNVERLE